MNYLGPIYIGDFYDFTLLSPHPRDLTGATVAFVLAPEGTTGSVALGEVAGGKAGDDITLRAEVPDVAAGLYVLQARAGGVEPLVLIPNPGTGPVTIKIEKPLS